jgi:competence protein ComK
MTNDEPYIVHQNTMLLMPRFSQYNEPLVDVYETSRWITVPGRSTEIIKESCRYFGSSLAGRQEGTKAVTNYDRLLPVAVAPNWDLYLFPIGSPKNATCIWMMYRHIEGVRSEAPNHCTVKLSNRETVTIEVSLDRVSTQLFRTGHFKSKLSQRLIQDPSLV